MVAAASDLGVKAAERALAASSIPPSAIDLIICATYTPDMAFPSTACLIQDRLGARPAAAFDLQAACSGFVYALVTAGQFVASGAVREFDGTGEIKRMWVDPAWRGAGLGSRLLRHLEAEALRLGHRVVRLDTRDVLTEAIGMYERAGYERIDRYNDNPHATHFFRKELP